MRSITFRRIAIAAVLGIAAFGAGSATAIPIADDNREPDLPCTEIRVPDGNKVSKHVYAIGVQVYRWTGSTWAFVGPIANLYADKEYHGKVGIHYAGPSWESNSGSKVVARRVDGCSPNPSAIAWLLLETVTADGPGIFARTTFIQRVNTAGGLAPASPGLVIGEEARVPYSTEYYFYRAKN